MRRGIRAPRTQLLDRGLGGDQALARVQRTERLVHSDRHADGGLSSGDNADEPFMLERVAQRVQCTAGDDTRIDRGKRRGNDGGEMLMKAGVNEAFWAQSKRTGR